MSLAVWTGVLPGLNITRARAYVWKTATQEALSGKESRLRMMAYPRVLFTLSYELLRDDQTPSDLKTLHGFFNAMGGGYDSFLYLDPEFNSVTAAAFGTGDGTTKVFQLVATYATATGIGAPELIQNVTGSPAIYENGGLVNATAYTLGPTGSVTFTSAPGLGVALTWTGGFYYRVRFDDDTLEMTQFMSRWWQSAVIKLRSIKL